MTELFNLLENPIVQLLLIAGAGMGLTWISEREEQRRVAGGLPRRTLKARLLLGLGFLRHTDVPKKPHPEDIWVIAARELGLPLDKVLLLKERVLQAQQPAEQAGVAKVPKKAAVKQG
jgi:hypothetical protein